MVLFFGPPGSGKSVQGELLVKRNGWHWLSTGELFRASKDPEVLKRLAIGELIDDALTNRVLEDALEEMSEDTHVVLDGYPRNTDQAQRLMDFLPKKGSKINAVIVFGVPEEELIRRLNGRGRDEDKLDVIRRRLEIYHEQTKPVLDFYRQRGVPVCEIDGDGSVNDVHERIQTVVEAQGLVLRNNR